MDSGYRKKKTVIIKWVGIIIVIMIIVNIIIMIITIIGDEDTRLISRTWSQLILF